ncbi:MAG: nucleotide exchange factor GrpE [Gammaproteobacteria bacterium HGW-Gammaproteobacteria-3]|jgi:molecular chaperone GrpE|nr:MAG: nucleotide exchange factor GrpE [Gammaproteobacteria bacterium HGW-Gammaproteobacteria-3]
MTSEIQENALLEDFRAYLEQSQPDPSAAYGHPDLHSLLSEMAGLKTEVKAESRQFKNTLETLRSALTTVQEDNKILAAEISAQSERLALQQNEHTRGLLLDIVDIYDRLSTGLDILEHYRPVRSLFKRARDRDKLFIKRFKEGQIMTLKRFEQLLQRHQVQAINCVGQLLDPLTMTAVETSHEPTRDNGIVLEELRKGFLFQNQILRLAEVKVNKIHPGKT